MTLTLEIWPWVKVMTQPWVMDNTYVKCYPNSIWQLGVKAWTRFWTCMNCELDLGYITLGQGNDTPLGHGQHYQDSTFQCGVMALTQIFIICALWPWPWRYDLGSWTTIVWYIIQIGQVDTKLWPGHDVNRRTDRVKPIISYIKMWNLLF